MPEYFFKWAYIERTPGGASLCNLIIILYLLEITKEWRRQSRWQSRYLQVPMLEVFGS